MMWADSDKDSSTQMKNQFPKGLIGSLENQGLVDQFLQQRQIAAPTPIKVFTVCVDQMSGKYMAFLGSEPFKRATGDSRPEAVFKLLAEQKLIVMAEID